MKRKPVIARTIALVFIAFFKLISCSEDEPSPSPAEVSAVFLSGEKGKSKSWKRTGTTYQTPPGEPGPLVINDCTGDNIFTFSNDDLQSFIQNEGLTKCNDANPDVVESGTWAFTADGKRMIILSGNIPNTTGQVFSYLGLPFPAEVVELSESTFKIRMTVTNFGILAEFIVTFERV